MFIASFVARTATALAMLLAATATPAQSDKSITVQDLLRKQDALDGQTVTVRGYIRECLPERCFLYWRQQDWSGRSLYYASIGPDAALDAATRGHLPGNVVLRAKLNTKCANKPPAISLCTGRAPALNDIEVIRWGR